MSFFKKKQSVFFVIWLFFVFDRILKFLSISFLFFKNEYISFQIPFSGMFFYFILSFVFLFIIFKTIQCYKRKNMIELVSWLLILTGASSNLLDRIKHGAVIDYLSLFSLMIFNLADVMIFIGVIILIKNLIFKINFDKIIL